MPKVTASDRPAAVSVRRTMPIPLDARIGRRRRGTHRRERRFQLVEPVVTADFFDQVDFTQKIDAKRRREDIPSLGCRRDRQPEAPQNPFDLAIRDRHAKDERKPAVAEAEAPWERAAPGNCRRPAPESLPAAYLLHERDGPLQGQHRRVDVRAALEARRRFGLQPKLLAGLPDGSGLEVRAFERDRSRARGHLGVGATHDAGDRLRSVRVRDDEHFGVERAGRTVERRKGLARARPPDPQLAPGNLRQVEGVHRVAELDAAHSW